MRQSKQLPLLIVPVLLALFELVIYLSNDMYLPALSAIKNDLQASDRLVQFSLTSWFLGGTVFHLVIGPISDRVGRRPVIFIGGLVFVISSLFCASTTSIVVLLIARFFQGTTVSAIAVAGYASVHELLDDIGAAKAIAVMMAITVFAPAFGPLLGGAIVLTTGWQSIFYSLAIFGSLVLVLLFIFLPESNPPETRKPLMFSTALRSYRNIIGNPEFRTNALTVSLLFGGTVVWIVVAPFLIIDEHKRSPLEFGLIQALIFSGFVVGAALVQVLTARGGLKMLLRIGLTIDVLGGLTSLVLTQIFPASLYPLIIGFFIYSIGTGLTFSAFQRLAIASSAEPTGVKMAVFATVMVFCASLASVVGSIFYNGHTQQVAFIILSICVMAAVFHTSSAAANILRNVEAE